MANSSVRSRKKGTGRVGTDTVRLTSSASSSVPNVKSTRRAISITGAILLGALFVFWFFGNLNPSGLKRTWLSTPEEEWEDRREQVKDAFVSSWDAYTKYAWGESTYPKIFQKLNLAHQATTGFTQYLKKAHR